MGEGGRGEVKCGGRGEKGGKVWKLIIDLIYIRHYDKRSKVYT